MMLKLKRTPGIYLVGFMGCGKTTIGRLLADRLGWTFGDLDADIEARQNCSIREIFENRGEEEFRRLESEAIRTRIRAIECGKPTVLALGGGAFVQPCNFDLVQFNGVSVWLDCPLPILKQRVQADANRPLARDHTRFEELFHQRLPAYSRADFRIEVLSDDPSVAVDALLGLPPFK